MAQSLGLSSVTYSYEGNYDDLYVEIELPTLYGRIDEVQLLRSTFLQLVRSKNAKTVVLDGVSGTGKTSLIDTLREPVCASQGFFCTGKYFQNSAITEPYSAIMAAFSDLCDLVNQSDDFEARKSKIAHALGADGVVLAKSISNLSPFLEDVSVGDSSTEETESKLFTKFKLACKSFLRAMSCDNHPIVLFIDDIQWMDDGSRQLIEMFLQDKELTNVLFIFAYRSDETEKIKDTLSKMRERDCINIHLPNLSADAVYELVSAALGDDKGATRELSALVSTRTLGNPLHVIQFMEAIQRERLLTFNTLSSSWNFDVEKIQKEMMVSETLADLLTRKARRLPSDILEALKIASVFGYSFSEEMLLHIIPRLVEEAASAFSDDDSASEMSQMNCSTDSIMSSISQAVKGGFLEKTRGGYQFSHDKIQSSFHSMLDDVDEERIHVMIGEMFLVRGGKECMYHAAVHLNCAPSHFFRTEKLRVKLARVNLEAAKISKEKSAYLDAADFLNSGLELLHLETKWSDHFDLSFETTESLAKIELILGHLPACKELTSEVLFRGKTVDMKVNALLLDVEVRVAGHEMGSMVATASKSLKELGVTMPTKVSKRQLGLKFLKVKAMLKLKSDNDILSLPMMSSRTMKTAVRLLLHVTMYCLLTEELDQAVFCAVSATELTLKYGLSSYSAYTLTVFGVAELTRNRHESAYRFGKLSVVLLDRFKGSDTRCAASVIRISTLDHWKDPFPELLDPLHEAMHAGFETADVVYSSNAVAISFASRIILGVNLKTVEDFMRNTYTHIGGLSQVVILRWSHPMFQCVLNLQMSGPSCWEDCVTLTGEIMNEDEFMSHAERAHLQILKVIVWTYKVMLAYFFEFYELAEEICEDKADIGKAPRHDYCVKNNLFFAAATNFARYRETGKREQLQKARRYKTAVKQYKRLCPHNVSAYLAFLDAEELSLSKSAKRDAVAAAYNGAIEVAANEDMAHLEGLANERAGFLFAKWGKRAQAERYFEEAMSVYRCKWGATAKYEWLQEKSDVALSMINDGACLVGGQELVGDFIVVSDELSDDNHVVEDDKADAGDTLDFDDQDAGSDTVIFDDQDVFYDDTLSTSDNALFDDQDSVNDTVLLSSLSEVMTTP
eukprot:CAMPEP_0119021732 /NCGR_PEP_ID=MMETSP1176-20130426/26576_1 /TAXON_ID=265551 /ORGANISM="Synedropsis recta cf, Strain CCMP1620" /LENGTH=1129 /DNA_ID=CAMNT_0006976413 /DNA_START=58 /DNA_END=3447 /DNA_ORIENTATION=+